MPQTSRTCLTFEQDIHRHFTTYEWLTNAVHDATCCTRTPANQINQKNLTTPGPQQSAAQPPLSFQDPALQLPCQLSDASNLLTAVSCRVGQRCSAIVHCFQGTRDAALGRHALSCLPHARAVMLKRSSFDECLCALRLAAVCRSAHNRAPQPVHNKHTAQLVTTQCLQQDSAHSLCFPTEHAAGDAHVQQGAAMHYHAPHTRAHRRLPSSGEDVCSQAVSCQGTYHPRDLPRTADIRTNTGGALPAASVRSHLQTTTLAAAKSSQLLVQRSCQPAQNFLARTPDGAGLLLLSHG
jgi:hypothetical protein